MAAIPDDLSPLLQRLADEIREVDVVITRAQGELLILEAKRNKARELRSNLLAYFAVTESTPMGDDLIKPASSEVKGSSSYDNVLRIITEDSTRWWEPAAVVAEMESRGLTPESDDPAGVIRVSLRRAVERGVAERKKHPTAKGYLYKANTTAAPAIGRTLAERFGATDGDDDEGGLFP